MSKPLTNAEFIKLLQQYPEDAIILIEYCNPREMTYEPNNNRIIIE